MAKGGTSKSWQLTQTGHGAYGVDRAMNIIKHVFKSLSAFLEILHKDTTACSTDLHMIGLSPSRLS